MSEVYPQESTGSVKSKKKTTKLENMHEFYLRKQMIEVCTKALEKVKLVYDKNYPGEREKWQSQQPVLAVTSDMSVEFNPKILNKTDLTKIKDECKEFVVNLISVARAIKVNMYFDEKRNNISDRPIFYNEEQLNQLNICCDPRDVFNKGENSREHNKRIARAFYGLSEIWPYIDDKQKPVILQLHGVDALIKKFKTDENFRNLVQNQCNDDGKAEKKFGVRWWGMSANRKGITEFMNEANLQSTCEADVTPSELNNVLTQPELVQEPVSVPQAVIQQETSEQRDIRLRSEASTKRVNESQAIIDAQVAAEAAKEPKPYVLTTEEKENNLLCRALANLDTIDGRANADPDNPATKLNVRDARKAIKLLQKHYPLIYANAELIKRTGAERPKWIPEGELARNFVKSRKVIDPQVVQGTYTPPTTIFGKLKSLVGLGGGTTSTKNRTKHKSNHKAKAKTQFKSKPKHKNKPKPKHRTKAKTIKKNKRAHHKFDKKYTRKR